MIKIAVWNNKPYIKEIGGGGVRICKIFLDFFFPVCFFFSSGVFFHHELRKSIMNIAGQNKN